MPESYSYQPLKYTVSIRVLDLQPASNFDAPIVIQLQECDLIARHSPRIPRRGTYEALSYVWGSKIGNKPVYCDGKSILVTENCEAALRRLRRRYRPRRLWIDALCIDQSNTRERSSQVSLMEEVYRNASQVIVWAGEHADAGGYKGQVLTQAINVLSSLSIDGHVKMTYIWMPPTSALRRKCADHPAVQKFRAAIEASEWSYRIWTLQELAFARKSIVMCGATTVRWRACNLLVHIQDQGPITTSDLGRSLMAREQLRLRMKRPKAQTDIRPMTHWQPPSPVWSILNNSADIVSKATDARDYVYGLYSFLKHADLEVPYPNYRKPVSIVYEHLTLAIIIDSKDLLVLIRACASSVDDRLLPSWVCNWSTSVPNEAHHKFWGKASHPDLPAGRGNEARACNGAPYVFTQQETLGRLPLTGVCIGTISATAISPMARRNCEELGIDPQREQLGAEYDTGSTLADEEYIRMMTMLTAMHLEEWSAFASKQAVVSVSDLDPVCTQRDVLESLCHIFFAHYGSANADTVESLGRNFDASLDAWADWVGTTFNTESYDPGSSLCCETTRRTNPVALLEDAKQKRQLPVITNRDDDVLCWLNCGRLALSTKDVMAGDKTVIVAGCEVPLVIRPYDNCYKLVATAHVPYAMHGHEWETDSSRRETFVLV